jgi:hypothetical protein
LHPLKYALLAMFFVTATACAQSSDSVVDSNSFTVPNPTIEERQAVLARYDFLDPQKIVPTLQLEEAVLYFDKNKTRVPNRNYLTVIDFSKNSSQKRFFIINMSSGAVWNIHTAHGRGSDPDWTGFATSFGNLDDSKKTSLGFYLTAETYYGEHKLSLRMDGLSSTNSNARSRAIVIHGADYVADANQIQGRSWGCPAVSMANRDRVINLLKGGSLLYASVNK